MSDTKSLSGVYRFAVATSCCTILLLAAGALVTSNDAADSVSRQIGRSPTTASFRRWLGAFSVTSTRIEFLAGLVSIFTLILAVWLTRSETRPRGEAPSVDRRSASSSRRPYFGGVRGS